MHCCAEGLALQYLSLFLDFAEVYGRCLKNTITGCIALPSGILPVFPYFLDYFPRVLLISDLTYPRVQYEGGNKTRAGSINFSLVRRALQSRVRHRLTSLYGTNTRYVHCSTVREYRPARQATWVVQVVRTVAQPHSLLQYYSRAGLIQGREEIK